MLLRYNTLSGAERTAGKKLAKRLLRNTPPREDFDVMAYAQTPRAILATAYLKSANVIGAFIYTDGFGHWWDDIAVKKGGGLVEIGRAEGAPFATQQAASDHLIGLIANIKAMKEHPLLENFRKVGGYDPERVTLLRVSNRGLDARYVVVQDDVVAAEASSFKERWNLEDESAEVAEFAAKLARAIVLHYAKELDAGPFFLSPPADAESSEDETRLKEAAAFLVACGFLNVSDESPSDVIFSVIGEPDENGMRPADLQLPPGLLKQIEGGEKREPPNSTVN